MNISAPFMYNNGKKVSIEQAAKEFGVSIETLRR
jgi:DeoR/GlpR family transcriptional regulator of sugar metabolism